MQNDPTQPDPATEIENAIRNAVSRVSPIVIIGLVVIGAITLGVFSTRKR